MIEAHYKDIRPDIKPGDVIAFGGRGFLSWLIKLGTWHQCSHVGIVDRVDGRVVLMESTSLPGVKRVGVQTTFLSDRLDTYKGEIWWLPLGYKFRDALDFDLYWKFLRTVEGRGYDAKQAYLSWSIFKAHEDYSKLFCSELVAGAWKAAGGWEGNPAEMTPADICKLKVYSGLYFQLIGSRLELDKYNTRDTL